MLRDFLCVNHSPFSNSGTEVNVTYRQIILQGRVSPPRITSNKEAALFPLISAVWISPEIC